MKLTHSVRLLIIAICILVLETIFFLRSQYHSIDDEFCSCEPLKTTKRRVINGTVVDKDDLKWVASIFKKYAIPEMDSMKVYEHLCTASIINPSWVLTSSKCFRSHQKFKVLKQFLFVAAGKSHNLSIAYLDDKNIRNIKNAILHPQFSFEHFTKKKFLAHDIALAELEHPFEFGDDIYPACLNEHHKDKFENADLFASGFGRTELVTRLVPKFPNFQINAIDKLNVFYVKQVSSCSKQFVNFTSNSLCGKSKRSGAYRGDEGAPLHLLIGQKVFIVGILSTYTEDFKVYTNIISVYTLVRPYLKWIDEQISHSKCTSTVSHFDFDLTQLFWFFIFLNLTCLTFLIVFYFLKRAKIRYLQRDQKEIEKINSKSLKSSSYKLPSKVLEKIQK